MHQRSRRAAQYLAALGVVAGLGVVASAQQPDFTGVWTTYTEPRLPAAAPGGLAVAAALALRFHSRPKHKRRLPSTRRDSGDR
jgi:hypothetical protein